ncbi:MAG: hypothetical protein HYW07_11730 [Candidatus Latescibacteria bacterium]|nr:hypothetical protein [Candidatus Latescibacterota bacterium]
MEEITETLAEQRKLLLRLKDVEESGELPKLNLDLDQLMQLDWDLVDQNLQQILEPIREQILNSADLNLAKQFIRQCIRLLEEMVAHGLRAKNGLETLIQYAELGDKDAQEAIASFKGGPARRLPTTPRPYTLSAFGVSSGGIWPLTP